MATGRALLLYSCDWAMRARSRHGDTYGAAAGCDFRYWCFLVLVAKTRLDVHMKVKSKYTDGFHNFVIGISVNSPP